MNSGEVVFQDEGIPVDFVVVPEAGVEDASFADLLHPGDWEVGAVVFWFFLGFVASFGIEVEEDAKFFRSGGAFGELIDFIFDLKVLQGFKDGFVDGVLGVGDFDGDVGICMPGMTVENASDGLGVIVIAFAGIGGGVDTGEASAFFDVGDEVGDEAFVSIMEPFFFFVGKFLELFSSGHEDVAGGVQHENGVEGGEFVAFEVGEVIADDGFVSSRGFAQFFDRDLGDGDALVAIARGGAKDEEFARGGGLDDGFLRHCVSDGFDVVFFGLAILVVGIPGDLFGGAGDG